MAVQPTPQNERKRERRYSTGFPIRCTRAEKEEIFARAERANRSASRFLVEFAIAQADHAFDGQLSGREGELLEGLMVQLRRLANNLQELASREHGSAADEIDAPAPAEIDDAVLEVRALLDQLRSSIL